MQTEASSPIVPDASTRASTTTSKEWAVVLAGGDGTRLSALTVDDTGHQVPKQFWSLTGGRTLVHDAIQRARRVVAQERICVIVAQGHRRHWSEALAAIDRCNIIVQPRNCGTAVGISLATLHIAKRDPFARIIFLPADHYVQDEAVLGDSMQETVALLSERCNHIVLLGIQPEGIDCDLGYIVPGSTGDDGARSVARFVEKPDASLAESLLGKGAVWNSFIFASTGMTLVKLLQQRMPRIVYDMWNALVSHEEEQSIARALQDMYQNLLPIDFSRTVLQDAHGVLRLVTSPACGWTDLGTPKRVARVVQDRHCTPPEGQPGLPAASTGVLSLALQCRRFGIGA